MIFGIERDRMQNWRIVNVSTRTAQRFAIRHALYPASGKRRHDHEMQHNFVIRMVHRLHGLWFRRVKDLVTNQLWVPGNVDASRSSRLITLRRVLNCRPTAVFFKYGNSGLIRPCKHHKFCPFCWGRIAAFMYRRIKTRIRAARKTNDGLILTCRVVSLFVPAGDFNSAAGLTLDEVSSYAKTLRTVFTRQRQQYRGLVKQLQRKTVGSTWRVLADPQENGWNIEVRQLLLVKPGKRALPWIKVRGAQTVFLASAKVSDDEALYPLIGRFMGYPAGLLTSYAELTAAYLHAGYGLRLVSGTGVFRTCGDGLLRAFKKDKDHGEATSTLHANEADGAERDSATDEVLV